MDWYDVNDVLYDGTKEEINKLKCPTCGGKIGFSFFKGRFEKKCLNCGATEVDDGSPIPNCVKFFGEKHVINE